MHAFHRYLTLALFALFGGRVQAAPLVTNIAAAQRSNSHLVDITYDLAAPGFTTAKVSLEISSNAGSSWTVPITSANGDLGPEVTPGTGKTIVWDAGADWNYNYSTQMRFRVTADDGFPVIPSGSFTMGRNGADTDNNAPPVTVTLDAFAIQPTETTKAKWDEVRAWAIDHGYTDLPQGGGKAADHPVQSVTWWDAVKWCNARSEMTGLSPCYTVAGNVMRTGTAAPDVNWSANGFRLPTEAEWEKAARGGVAGRRFPWGTDTITHSQANYTSSTLNAYDISPTRGGHPIYSDDTVPSTNPVTAFPANGYGLFGMSGNVWEWCWDWYGAAYYTSGVTNPRGPATGSARIMRGGSWGTFAYGSRCGNREFFVPINKFQDVGFRTVLKYP